LQQVAEEDRALGYHQFSRFKTFADFHTIVFA
jgi:hypothetical protein